MIWKWIKRRPKASLFELLDDEVTEVGRAIGAPLSAADMGRLEAMSRTELFTLVHQQRMQIKRLKIAHAKISKHLAYAKHLLAEQSDRNSSAKKLARLDAERQRESQNLRNQFQIRMTELSARVSDLEGQLIKAQGENGLLVKRLKLALKR